MWKHCQQNIFKITLLQSLIVSLYGMLWLVVTGYDRLIIKVGLLTWWNKWDIISLKKTHETRWFLGLTRIGMDFICFWEAEPEIGRNYLDFYLCKDETRNVIACKPGVPYSIAFAYASQFPVIFYSYLDNKNKKKKQQKPTFQNDKALSLTQSLHHCSLISPPYSSHLPPPPPNKTNAFLLRIHPNKKHAFLNS